MDTAGDGERHLPERGRRPAMLVAVAATVVAAFGLLTTLAPDRGPTEPEFIDVTELVEPESEAGFRPVARLDEGPWDSFRIDGAYLFTGETTTVITDDDGVFDVELPELEVLFGAIDAGGFSVAFGTTAHGPAVWRSPDTRSWLIERLPWDGTVRAGAQIEGRLVLIGIEKDGPAFHHVTATQTADGWQVTESNIPDPGVISVPGGFVARGRATDADFSSRQTGSSGPTGRIGWLPLLGRSDRSRRSSSKRTSRRCCSFPATGGSSRRRLGRYPGSGRRAR